MNLPPELRYAKSHEWVRVEGDLATIGITDYAQDQLGDVVYIELPEVGRTLQQEETFGSIESVKAVSELLAPVSGEVVEVNEELLDTPETVNEDPYSAGWMIIVRMDDPSEVKDLLTAEQYQAFVEEEG
ncbi:MAG TPA: glycine cleavage system protein GcvH [Armatimonadota bacterium]|nr:glycine cleavage system protein GcvH [Armatimonadota bacterium]HOJ20402.1 glycine cleavage system protein GcvH [Armatimonadota bacterium]HOM80573.1 glycine cleavage system protein GcvH [Armatimonadota bacterium]HPO72560.1 glycine cleavage system protein GcvH [Armatimonadota bacterium]HPT99449.1 glycine cleavage system protein GcvH [Armatimonadota bacterium]